MADVPAAAKPYQFQKGKSGNPGGRSRAYAALARYIRDKTNNGQELADHLLAIARNKKAEARVRLLAIETLLDRGIGKPVQAVDLRVEEPKAAEQAVDWSQVSLDKREALLHALATLDEIAEPKPADESDGGDAPIEH